MTSSARLVRLIAIILLSNFLLVGWAALWHHAGAQDSQPTESSGIDSLPLVTLPPPDQTTVASGAIPPGFVLDEIQKMAQDPNSGLALKPLEYPSLELSREPVEQPSQPLASNTLSQSGLDRVQSRLEAVSQMAMVASSLAKEASVLTREGKLQEAQMVIEQVEQLKKSISRLTRPAE